MHDAFSARISRVLQPLAFARRCIRSSPGGGCRFLPTCSEYAAIAIAIHGPLRGSASGHLAPSALPSLQPRRPRSGPSRSTGLSLRAMSPRTVTIEKSGARSRPLVNDRKFPLPEYSKSKSSIAGLRRRRGGGGGDMRSLLILWLLLASRLLRLSVLRQAQARDCSPPAEPDASLQPRSPSASPPRCAQPAAGPARHRPSRRPRCNASHRRRSRDHHHRRESELSKSCSPIAARRWSTGS